jgi:NAD(P)-dependent dehydrogenase (short-subunit alcohol dehydrogenase family)
MTEIKGRTAVVTGGQRGLGKQLAAELLARGAAKVYVTARTPVESDDPRLIPFAADITDPISVAALAVAAPDATLVVNNAGVWSPMPSPCSPPTISGHCGSFRRSRRS